MDFDEPEIRKSDNYEVGTDLSDYSIEELKSLIQRLNHEISRIEAVLEEKQGDRNKADAIFKS